MNPLFLFGGIWCFYVFGMKGQSKWVRRAGCLITGLLFFLGCWNHIIFVPTAASVTVVYIIASRMKPAKIPAILLWFAAGVLIGAVPKLYGVAVLGYPLFPEIRETVHSNFSEAFLNIVYTLGGDGLYIRACGRTIFSVNWFLPLCVLGSASVIFRRDVSPRSRRMWIAAAACMILSFLGTLVITPKDAIGSRIWILPLWFVPLLLASALPVYPKVVRAGLGAAIVIINIAATGTNYFYNFLQDKGIPQASVYVGGRYDNSWDFIDLRPLANKIADYNNKPVYIEDYNVDRLQFLLPEDSMSRVRLAENLFTNEGGVEVGSLLVFYDLKDRALPQQIEMDRAVGIRREELCTPHYIVFEVVEVK